MDEKERQYREYLALREQNKKKTEGRDYKVDTTYGEYFTSNVKHEEARIRQEKATHARVENSSQAREKDEYLKARGMGHNQKKQIAKNASYNRNDRADAKAMKRSHRAQHGSHGKGGKGRKIRRIVIIVLLAIVILGGAAILGVMGILGSVKQVDVDKNNIGINPDVASQLDGYRNIAILGTDARAGEDDSEVRSDAIIVASINEETNEVKMFSVYRDTLLYIGDEGYDKITHAYYFGGPEKTLFTLNKNLDLNVEEVVVINWKTVADMIDSVGGIEVDVQESEIEEMNKYIPNTAKNVDGPKDLIEEPGTQTLNGVQAVTYSRIRKDALTGDYRRNERMKIVFAETFKKLKGAGYIRMLSVAANVAPEVRTNLTTNDMLKLMMKFGSFDMTDSTTGFPYDVSSWTGQGAAGYAWFGPPVNLANNVTKLHEQFFNQSGYTPSDLVYKITQEISYKTGIW